MKKTNSLFGRVFGLVFCLCAALLLAGTISIHADENISGKAVCVSTSKQLQKAINDPEVSDIYFVTGSYNDITIKANKNARNKCLFINAPNAKITNKAVFFEIQILAVYHYTEKASGNFISFYINFGIDDKHTRFTVAKNKTLECLNLITYDSFDDRFEYILREGAKINEFSLYFDDVENNHTMSHSDYDKSKNEVTFKYNNHLGESRSYVFTLDQDGRILKMVSDDSDYKYDYTFSYDNNGNCIKVSGYDDYDGNVNMTRTFKDDLMCTEFLYGDSRKYEAYITYDENNRKIQSRAVTVDQDGESEVFYKNIYDSKGRYLSQLVDYGKDSIKEAKYYTYNSKGLCVKTVQTFYDADGQQTGDSNIRTYKYNKLNLVSKEIYTCGSYKETTKYIYNDFGFLIDTIFTVDEGAGRVDMPMTLEEFKDLNHLLFIENQQEKVFERHTSQCVTFYNDFPLTSNNSYLNYITPDSFYALATEWMEYINDRLCYSIHGTADPKNSSLVYLVDLSSDWKSSLWRLIPTDENEWFDYDNDQLIEAYKEDGKIHIITRNNKDSSRKFAEENIGDYEGETYLFEDIFDANNYDYLESIITKELNGTSEIVERLVIEYDLPEPESCTALRCAFETTTKNMVNVKFVINPGTKDAISKSFKVPIGSTISYIADDMANLMAFSDSKCENPVTEPWDRTSDLTRYLKYKDTDTKAE